MNQRSLPAKRSWSPVLAELLLHCHCLVRVANQSPGVGAGGRLIVAVGVARHGPGARAKDDVSRLAWSAAGCEGGRSSSSNGLEGARGVRPRGRPFE